MPVFIDERNNAVVFDAPGPNWTMLGRDQNDRLSTSYNTAKMIGGRGDDELVVDYAHVGTRDVPLVHGGAWRLWGREGADTMRVRLDYDIENTDVPPLLSTDQEFAVHAYGGAGEDTYDIEMNASIFEVYASPNLELSTSIADTQGASNVRIDNAGFNWDADLWIRNEVMVGDEDDVVDISTLGEANNFTIKATSNIELGDGDNHLTLYEVSGRTELDITSGSGNDVLNIEMVGDDANSAGYNGKVFIDTGAGDDDISVIIDAFVDFAVFEGVIDAGSGRNTVVARVPVDPFRSRDTGIHVISGDDHDEIELQFGVGNTVHAGGYSDRIVAGSGGDSLYGEEGGDYFLINQKIWEHFYGFSVSEQLSVDFDPGEGDVLMFRGFGETGSIHANVSSIENLEEFAVQVGGDFMRSGDHGILELPTINQVETPVILFEDLYL